MQSVRTIVAARGAVPRRALARRVLPALVAATFPLHAAAQTAATAPPPAPPTLPEVTVSATRIEQPVSEVPATVTVIDAREIDRQVIQNILDLVRHEPGVAVPRDPSRSGAQDYNIRGLDGNRVLIQVDGIRTPSLFSFGVAGFNTATRNLVDLDSLKAVEILRGPSSSLYGSDALGGVITYLTKDPSDYLVGGKTSFFSAKASYASDDDAIAGTITAAGAWGRWQALVLYTQRRGHEMETQGTNDSTGPARTTANPQTANGDNVLGKIVYAIDATQRVRFTGEYLETDVSTDVLSLNASTPRTTALAGDDTSRRSRLSLDYAFAGNGPYAIAGATAQVYWQQADARSRTNETRTGTSTGCSGTTAGSSTCFIPRDFQYTTETWGLQGQLEHRFAWGATAHRLIYGLDVARVESSELRDAVIFNQTTGTISRTLAGDTFPARDFPDSRTTTTGLYLQDEVAFADGRAVVTPGIRYDDYRLKVSPDAIYTNNTPPTEQARDYDDDAWSPKIAASWKLTPDDLVYAQYAYGFRAPPFTELNAAFRNPVQSYTLIPNPDLVSETSRGLEIGAKGGRPTVRYALAAFYNRYDDFIDPQVALACPSDPRCVPGFATTFTAVNRGNVTIQGFEGRGEWTFLPGWTLGGSFAWAKGEDDDLDVPINSILPLTGVASLRYVAPSNRWGGAAIATGVQRKKEGDINQPNGPLFASPGFGIVDLTAWWTFAPGANLNVGVFNVFDKTYWLWADLYRTNLSSTNPAIDRYTQPGRWVGVNLSLAL